VLDIDVERIGICGDSAGGALAAALVHNIKARSLAPARFQMLVYPVLDASQSSESMRTCRDTPVWNSRLNRKMWKLYLSGHPGSAEDPLASPAHARTLDGLPATYVEVNEFDCLRDEALAYHERLRQSGVAVTLVRNAGTMHGFELNYDSAVTQKIIRTRISYMDTMFSDTRR